ncbi:MAG: adenine phosphoribosyltransferase, partial [Pseudomonadota bacterium]
MSDIDLRSVVRAIPDYPKAGIMFRDVTTLFGDPAAFAQSVDQLADRLAGTPLDKIAG